MDTSQKRIIRNMLSVFFVHLTLFKRKPAKRKDSLYTDSIEYTYYIYEKQVLQQCP